MHPLTAKLVDLQRRLIWRRRALATCRAAAVVIGSAVGLGLVDYFVRYADRGLRVMASGALAAIAAWAIYRYWIVPARERLDPLAIARRLEGHFPQLHDRLASAVEFLSQSEHDLTAGSATLRRAVVADADLATDELHFDDIVNRRPLRQAATWAAIAVAFTIACAALNPTAVRTAAMRLAAPWGATEWARVNHLEFRDPPTRLALGQAFEVELVDRGGMPPDDVRIEYRFPRDGFDEIDSQWMQRAGDVLVARRDNVRQPFAFRAEGGDDRSMPWTNVEVIDPPRLESLTIKTLPPEYTGLPAAKAERDLDVLAGTRIEVSGVANEPLGAARVIVGDMTIPDDISTTDSDDKRRAFHMSPEAWVVEASGTYSVELTNPQGIVGAEGPWNLRVETDSPPSIAWDRPREDAFVLPTAVVPLAATVKDNLAIANVELQVSRSDQPTMDATSTDLYRGPERAASSSPTAIQRGESRAVEYDLDLAPLRLSAGMQLTLNIAARDYRPGIGQTTTPRRITIVDRNELDARLADEQSQLTRRLDEALSLQRATRESVRSTEIQLHEAGQLTPNDRDALQATELNQRRVSRMLTNPDDGLAAAAAATLEELRTNGLDQSDAAQPVEQLQQALHELAKGALASADEQLTSARKMAESKPESPTPEVEQALTSAGSEQEQATAALEQLQQGLAGTADLARMIRDLAKLREDQLAHIKVTRDEIGLETSPLELRELSRQQRATLNKAAAAEETLAGRYDRIEHALDALARDSVDREPDAAGRLADAIDLARQMGIAGTMRQATRDLNDNRVGQALTREQQAADAIQELLDTIRADKDPRMEELLAKLRAAERELAALRREAAKLREQIDQNTQPTAQLEQQRQSLQDQINKLAKQLQRLRANDASQSAQQADQKLSQSPSGGGQKGPSGEQARQAEQDLAKAAEQLAQRRQDEEENWARIFLDRFRGALAAMVKEQSDVITATTELDAARAQGNEISETQKQAAAPLAQRERQLAEDAGTHADLLAGLHVIGTALADAERQSIAAADLLQAGNTSAATQWAEERVLERLQQIASALEQTAQAANQPPPGGGAPGGQGGGQGPSRRPTFDLFEVKLLRTMQADLNERTQIFHNRTTLKTPVTDQERKQDQAEAQQLAAEQGHLAELVQELLSRNNKEQGAHDER